MEEITTLVATLILPATITAVPVCFVVNAMKGRERPLREAANKAQSLVASGAVWLALALAALYGVLESIDRWGVWVLLALIAGPSVAGVVVVAVASIWRERRAGPSEDVLQHPMGSSHDPPSITAMSSTDLGHALAAAIDRAAAVAPPDEEQVTVELSISPDGRLAPTRRRNSDRTPHVDITLTLQRVDALEAIRRLLPEGWTLSIDGDQDDDTPTELVRKSQDH